MAERLSVIEALDIAELFRMLFEQIGQVSKSIVRAAKQSSAPWAIVESIARGFYGAVDILAITFCDLRQLFARCGIVGRESLSGRGVDPLAIDQHRRGLSMNSATCG